MKWKWKLLFIEKHGGIVGRQTSSRGTSGGFKLEIVGQALEKGKENENGKEKETTTTSK